MVNVGVVAPVLVVEPVLGYARREGQSAAHSGISPQFDGTRGRSARGLPL